MVSLARRRKFGVHLHCLVLGTGALGAPAIAWAQAEAPLPDRVTRLERTLSSNGLMELAEQVDRLQQELRQLRGELENQAYTLEQVRQSQRDAYADVDRRLGLLEQQRAGVAAPGLEPPLSTLQTPDGSTVAGSPSDQTMAIDVQPPTGPRLSPAAPDDMAVAPMPGDDTAVMPDPSLAATAPPAAAAEADEPAAPIEDEPLFPSASQPGAPAAPATGGAESEAAYRDAFALLKAGQYEEAIAAFQAYLQQYPDSQYADNAQYWVGEAYYVMRQYEPAIEQYQRLITGYPDSQKQSHAMLKVAYSYDELGMTQQAVSVLTELKQRFPGSAAARLADERLQRMRAESP